MLWYNMSGQVLKQIKADILKKRFSKAYICEKYNINDTQFEMVCKWKLKIGYKKIDDRITALENKIDNTQSFGVGSQVYCKDDKFSVGTVIEVFKQEFDYVSFMAKFTSREFPTLCNISKSGEMTTSPDGKVRTLKWLSNEN